MRISVLGMRAVSTGKGKLRSYEISRYFATSRNHCRRYFATSRN